MLQYYEEFNDRLRRGKQASRSTPWLGKLTRHASYLVFDRLPALQLAYSGNLRPTGAKWPFGKQPCLEERDRERERKGEACLHHACIPQRLRVGT